MNDKAFLMWLHARFTDVYGEDPLIDHLHKFRAVISSVPETQSTPSDGRGGNSLSDIQSQQLTFEEVVKPVIRWLAENKNPHTSVIIDSGSAEMFEGVECVNTGEFVRD